MSPEKNEIPDFYKVQHVELDGFIYDIFPINGEFGMFILVNNETQEMERLKVEELESRGFSPITGLPENPIDHIQQTRSEIQDSLDNCCRGRLFIP